ncbi:MAG: glycosyltransferase [Candidatus Babeliales bacterium]
MRNNKILLSAFLLLQLGDSCLAVAKESLCILFLVDQFPSLPETFVLNQITGLIDRGHNVYILARLPENGEIVHADFKKYKLEMHTHYQSKSYEDGMPPSLQNIDPDILFCHFGLQGNYGLQLKKKYFSRAKLITVFHGYDMSRLLNEKPDLYKELLPALDLALPISQAWRKKLIKMGSNKNKTIVHHMGIECSQFTFQPRQLHKNETIEFISIARLVEKKGIQYALQAFAQTKQEHSNIHYTIIGDGPLRNELLKEAKELGISNNVSFRGWQESQQVAIALNKAHIMIAPSVTSVKGDMEGIPVSLMEAMATGLPVLSTNHSGIPELIDHGISGYLSPEKDVQQLAANMQFMIQNPGLWPTIGLAGRQKVENEFNIITLNDQLEQMLFKLIEDKI